MSASSPKNFFVWIVLGLVIVGLMGFGATSFSGGRDQLGQVDGRPISMQSYANALSARLQAERAADGSVMTIAEAERRGITDQVLARVVAARVLDADAADQALSVGDSAVLEEITVTPAFQNVTDGSFSRESYRYLLQQRGLSEAEYEAELRADMARALLQQAIVAGVPTPDDLTDAVLRFSGQTRAVDWAMLTADDLPAPLPQPTDAELQDFYAAQSDRFMTPERLQISAAVLTPEMIATNVPEDEDALRALYAERARDYIRPEMRLVERVVYGSSDQAQVAAASLLRDEATFEDLVAAQGLDLSDVDLGDVSAADLGPAADAVFGAEDGAVVGPVNTSLGPAIFRINGVLPASEVPFEAVRADLQAELSGASTRRLVAERREGITDLLAGGARIEDLAERTEMELQTFTWTGDGDDGGLASYAAVADAVDGLTEGALPELIELDDGGIAALRLDAVEPAAPIPFEQVEAEVRIAWAEEALETALAALALDYAAQLNAGARFADLGLTAETLDPLRRSEVITAAPDGFITAAFDVAEGEAVAISANGRSAVLRVDAITAGDEADPALAPARDALGRAFGQGIADDLLNAYAVAAQVARDVTVDRNAQLAVHGSFR